MEGMQPSSVIKIVLSNERTLVAWLRTGATLSTGAFVAGVLGGGKHGRPGMLLLLQSLVAVLLGIVAVRIFRWRARKICKRDQESFAAPLSPALAAAALIGVLSWTAYTLVVQEISWQFGSDDCMSLGPATNGTPPYAYVTFHGAGNLARTALCHPSHGVGGVHRYSLRTGSYAGPVTDQRAALMMWPRGLVLFRGLLLVAEAKGGDSSLSVFGACAGGAPRAFLGRVRPEGSALTAAFAHPYGLAATRDTVRVSAQDGGAVVSLNMSTGTMEVAHVVNTHRASVLHSGVRRALAAVACSGSSCTSRSPPPLASSRPSPP
jgi:uncharacterized membrane protein YidH (DUF202 family)